MRGTAVRPVRALLASSVAALLLAGCAGAEVTGSGTPASPSPSDNGVAGQAADEILAKSKAALQGAGAVRIKGTSGRGEDRFDIDMRYAGASAQGTISVAGEPIEMRRIGQTVYVKGSREFWSGRVPAAAAELLTGKWLKSPVTGERLAQLASLTDLSEAADGILDPNGTLTKGERKTVASTPAIALISHGADGGKLYVATAGKPYPLLVTPTDPKDSGQIAFSDFGKRVTVSPPPADLVIDVSKLGG
jgi:hypothetical protein